MTNNALRHKSSVCNGSRQGVFTWRHHRACNHDTSVTVFIIAICLRERNGERENECTQKEQTRVPGCERALSAVELSSRVSGVFRVLGLGCFEVAHTFRKKRDRTRGKSHGGRWQSTRMRRQSTRMLRILRLLQSCAAARLRLSPLLQLQP